MIFSHPLNISILTFDRGGTNLRVGFIELLGNDPALSKDDSHVKLDLEGGEGSRVARLLEKSWPIGEQLKNNNGVKFFNWIGECIAEVVHAGCKKWPREMSPIIPLGVTFSFPMMSASPITCIGKLLANNHIVNIRYRMPLLWIWARVS